MKQTLHIAQRELFSLFYSPIPYVVMGLFAFGITLIFMVNFGPGQPATLRPTLDAVIWLMIFLVPAISMRLLSDEMRSGSIELLMTAPISDMDVVLGKWLGALGFFFAMISPFIVFWVVLEIYGDPEWGVIVSSLIGLMLVGGLYLAIGVFASAVTQNQIIALLLTIFVICLLTIMLYFLPQSDIFTSGQREAMHFMNINHRFADFTKGLLDIRNFVYFLSVTALFLFLAVKTVEAKRWW
jgi:ABC-2 type transport system permease protein